MVQIVFLDYLSFPSELGVLCALARSTPGFERFRSPKNLRELRNNPNLVNSKKYLSKHDDLEKFLKRHPDVKREVLNHPKRVFGRFYRDDHARWRHR